MKLDIWVVDHRGITREGGHNEAADPQAEGDIIKVWNVRERESVFDERYYADFGGFHDVSQHYDTPPDLIGFFGYRKYLWKPEWLPLQTAPHCDHAPGWLHASKQQFNVYRSFLMIWEGDEIKEQLQHCDIIQSAPYIYPHSGIEDFVRYCGSASAGKALLEVTKRHGWYDDTVRQNWPNFLMITHWPIYKQMVDEITPLMLEMFDHRGMDSTNAAYLERPMIYILERLYPLWLKKSGYKVEEVPLLHCREVGPKAPGW